VSVEHALFFIKRSAVILDLAAVDTGAPILLYPANHCLPIRVVPYPSAADDEAIATCLAAPEVHARAAGVIAWRQQGHHYEEGHFSTRWYPFFSASMHLHGGQSYAHGAAIKAEQVMNF